MEDEGIVPPRRMPIRPRRFQCLPPRFSSAVRYKKNPPCGKMPQGGFFCSKVQKALGISREDLLALAVGDLLVIDGTDIHTG